MGDAVSAAALEFSIDDAVQWADHFTFPADVFLRDSRCLVDCNNDLSAFIRLRQSQVPHTRLSSIRLRDAWDPSDPDLDLLLEMADQGVEVLLDKTTFECNPVPPRFSPTYTLAHLAVNKMLYELYVDGLAVILPTQSLRFACPPGTLHFSRLGHVGKKGKAHGRVTCNYSYSILGHCKGALNSEGANELSRQKYGPIVNCTVCDLALMILREERRALSLGKTAADLELWTTDLKGAFTLLFFKPEDCGLLALPLTNDLSLVPLAGNFGLGQFPFAFNVASRSLIRKVRQRIKGGADIYVDDIPGCCLSEEVAHDIDVVKEESENLLGDDALAEDKTKRGRSMDWIGWNFNLDTFRVGIADRNYFKTLRGFMAVEEGMSIQVLSLHKLASWASRYVLICPYMSPFSGYLYSAFAGYSNADVFIRLPSEAYLVIMMWRFFLVMMKLDSSRNTLCIRSFLNIRHSLLLIEYDGCPEGIGFILHRRDSASEQWSPFYAVSVCHLYDLDNDPRYQNTMEFIGIVMGFITLRWLGYHHVTVDILGDNTASLAWSNSLRFRPGSSTAAALTYILTICMRPILFWECPNFEQVWRTQLTLCPEVWCHPN